VPVQALKTALLWDPTIRTIFTCFDTRATWMIKYLKERYGESVMKSKFLLFGRGFSCDDGSIPTESLQPHRMACTSNLCHLQGSRALRRRCNMETWRFLFP
jgi:hypothetical protein